MMILNRLVIFLLLQKYKIKFQFLMKLKLNLLVILLKLGPKLLIQTWLKRVEYLMQSSVMLLVFHGHLKLTSFP